MPRDCVHPKAGASVQFGTLPYDMGTLPNGMKLTSKSCEDKDLRHAPSCRGARPPTAYSEKPLHSARLLGLTFMDSGKTPDRKCQFHKSLRLSSCHSGRYPCFRASLSFRAFLGLPPLRGAKNRPLSSSQNTGKIRKIRGRYPYFPGHWFTPCGVWEHA